MKKILCTIAAAFLLPIIFIGGIINGILYILQLLFRTINFQYYKFMIWIDKNITSNINIF